MNSKEVVVGKRNDWENSIGKNDFVLDIGCWSGHLMSQIGKRCKNVYGMDIDEEKIKPSPEKLKKKIKLGDVTKKIPFKNKFDWIIFGEVLEHVSDDEKALKNISDSLKKGGRLILTTPRSVRFFEIWDPAWVRWKFLGGQKHYHYKKEELFGKLKKYNLEVREYYIIGNLIWDFFRWFNVFINYGLRIKKKIYIQDERKGFFDWIILAEKI